MIVLIPLLKKFLMHDKVHQELKANIDDRVVVKFVEANFHGEATDFFDMKSGEIKVNVD